VGEINGQERWVYVIIFILNGSPPYCVENVLLSYDEIKEIED
jgi:hypothetical protein